MIRKTALMTAAAAVLFAAPALAQDMPAETPAQPEAAAQAEGSVAPGAQVQASDGAVLGVLEGATTDATGQQALAVRANDGSLKEVPIAGASLSEGAVVTAWTSAEFDAAPSVTDATADASATAEPLPEAQPQMDPLAEPESPMTDPEATETPDPSQPE